MVRSERGFTLIEVLIAMAITALIAVTAYRSLAAVLTGVESARFEAERTRELSRAMSILSRDIRQLANRAVRDEFGERVPALEGGVLAREMLGFTRAGWHNTVAAPRSGLQRVAYYLDEDRLVRAVYPVLDRTGAIEPREAVLIGGVEQFDVRFLADAASIQSNRDLEVDRRQWQENWIANVSVPGQETPPPVAVEVRLTVEGWGQLERLYVLPAL